MRTPRISGKSKAYDWLLLMAIALAIATQKAIPCKYGDGVGVQARASGRISLGL